MRKRLAILLALIVLGGLSYVALNTVWIKTAIHLESASATTSAPAQGSDAQRRRAPPVEVATAKPGTSTTDISAIGSLLSGESVEVTSETAGRIAAIQFDEGNEVKAGDVLVRLDDALATAELKDAEARLKLAQATYDRTQALQKSGAATRQAFDEAASSYGVARAATDLARTRVDKLSVRAPFDGVLGFRQVSVGAYVQAGTELVNLEKIDELKVAFSVPELYLAEIAPGQEVEVTVDAWPGTAFDGSIYAVNPQIDVNGRALQVRATLNNTERKLRPGLLARILVKGKDEAAVVLVPESAIVPRGGDTYVFRIENGKAVETAVTTGKRRDGMVEIVKGLQADAVVVTAGQARLKDGSEVEIVEAGTAAADG
jgi:membrane fusion protein (multidrug efflux system)